MFYPKERLSDLTKVYLIMTRNLLSAVEAGNVELSFSLIKDREELKTTMTELRRYTKVGKKEAHELLPLLVEIEELEHELEPLLKKILNHERKLLSGFKGYLSREPQRSHVNIST